MQAFVDASGDDGQQPHVKSSQRYTLGIIVIAKKDLGALASVEKEFREMHRKNFGCHVRPELKWTNLNDNSRKLVAEKLFTSPLFSKVVISVDKFNAASGWAQLHMPEKQFRAHVLRSLLWLLASHANLNSHAAEISLEFDRELADDYMRPLNREAGRLKSKKISIGAGVDSKQSFGVQLADCLCGCYNHHALGKSNLYSTIRKGVCEIELTARGTTAPKYTRQCE
ncbi:MAG: DUF3800 domain-containing protein [Candidatus Micrarchaeota archaeon]